SFAGLGAQESASYESHAEAQSTQRGASDRGLEHSPTSAISAPLREFLRLSFNHPEQLRLLDDQVLVALDLDLRPGVLAVDDGVADLHRELGPLAVVQALARAGGDDPAADGLLLGGLGQVD